MAGFISRKEGKKSRLVGGFISGYLSINHTAGCMIDDGIQYHHIIRDDDVEVEVEEEVEEEEEEEEDVKEGEGEEEEEAEEGVE